MSESKNPSSFDMALTEAEAACSAFLNDMLELKAGVNSHVGVRRDRSAVDCMVFDIGSMLTGDVASFRARNYHWRATADFYDRKRENLQRTVMRLLERFPVAPQFEAEHPLLADTNVVHFRIAPESNAVSAISTVEMEVAKGSPKVAVYSCTVLFDVVFNAGPRAAICS